MKKQNIETIIRELFRQGYNAYRESYPDQIMEAIKTARVTAAGYWGTRTPEEEQRDKEAGVTLRDYEYWVVAELKEQKEIIN